MNDDSTKNIMELAMGLSMASLFSQAMGNSLRTGMSQCNHPTSLGASTFDQIKQIETRYLHAIIDGQQCGPYTLKEFVDLIQQSRITPDTYVWKQGMPDWALAKDVADVAPNLSLQPPPTPINK